MDDKRFALLIDSDNISAKYIEYILNELTRYGVVTYKRIYGDWTSPQTNKWKQILLRNSISPIQQFANTVGKNATDSAMIIDAMDILYSDKVDGFCIVSSDGDFTRLSSRLRESGMLIIGMGESKTPISFRAACNVFTDLEILMDQDETDVEKVDLEPENEASANKEKVIKAIVTIITENENNGKRTGLGEIGSRLTKQYPDFDVRRFGYSRLSKFLEEVSILRLCQENSTMTVQLLEDRATKEAIVQYILTELSQHGETGMELSQLSNQIHARFQQFTVKDYGYSKFSKFIQSIPNVTVLDQRNKKIVLR